MAGETYLGIDAGTSVVKAAIFDENGEALAVKGKPLDLTHGGGGITGAVEQDFNVIYDGFEEVVKAAIAEAGAPPSSVALTGQGASIVDEWTKSGVSEQVFRTSGGTMFPGAPGACLKWLDENEPESLDRAATAGYVKDGIFGRLTGERACDPSDSSMPLGDGTGMGY